MIYVDALRYTRKTRRWRHDQSCHMVAGTLKELHAFAGRLGLRRGWFQDHHYDLTANKRLAAVEAGAVETDRNTFVAAWRAMQREARDA